MSEHSPTPWVAADRDVYAENGNGECVFYMPGRPSRADDEDYDEEARRDYRQMGIDRDFIVRAANAHEALVEAILPLAFSDVGNPPPGVKKRDWNGAVIAARAALALARGEQP